MKALYPLGVLFFICALAGCRGADAVVYDDVYRDPQKMAGPVEKFIEQDRVAAPPKGAVVCVGSSSIRMWHGRLAEDLEPLTVVGRGFGGSNMNELLHYLEPLVLKHEPRAVLIYEGDNDIAQGVPPGAIAQTLEKVLGKIEAAQPGCRVYVLAVKPSPKRWSMWPKMQEVNALFASMAEERDDLTYIDIAGPMLGDDGQPRAELFVNDRLHMNRAGYELWRDAVRPVLVEAERRHEK